MSFRGRNRVSQGVRRAMGRPATEGDAVIELIGGLPEGVVGLEGVGEVTSADYSSVAFPAVEDALSRHKKIDLLHVLGERFTGYEAGGGWADAKLGVLQAFSWRRIAVVTDLDHIRHQVRRAGWLVPGEMKLFSNAQRAEAMAWVSAGSHDEGGDRG
jgi:hypothetical protein